MLQDNEFGQELDKLSLPQIFQRQDLCLEEILGIKDIQNKIKRNMKIFTEYCRSKPQFTDRLISLGLKCPMHESNNLNMKTITYVAADILTCDHQTLADLFILPTKKAQEEDDLLQNGDQIEEEIEIEDSQLPKDNELDKYMFLVKILDYINSEELDQNCLNYIAKALYILIRRKLSQFLQFFNKNDLILKKLVSISHYPAVGHLLAKLLTDDEDNISDNALLVKSKLIPLLLEKLHTEIGKSQTCQILQCIEDAINSSRYGDLEQRSHLQKMSDVMVSASQIDFYIQKITSALSTLNKTLQNFFQLFNSSTYLYLITTRMNMDQQQQDFNYNEGPQQFKPTLQYQIDGLFLSFCKIIKLLTKLPQFKPIIPHQYGFSLVRIIEPLIIMTKNSRFGTFYAKISKQQRLSAFQTLIDIACYEQIKGIFNQNITNLIQKMLVSQQLLAQTSRQIIFPGDLFIVIQKHSGQIGSNIKILIEETVNKRNKNQSGIFFRKLLILLDNYFKHISVCKHYPDTGSLSNIFPSFNIQNCKTYAEKASILGHPSGNRVKQVEQFTFIEKNKSIIHTYSPQLQEPKKIQQQKQVKAQQQSKKQVQLVFSKINGKLQKIKQRVRQKHTDKEQAMNQSSQTAQPQISLPELPKQLSSQDKIQTHQQRPQTPYKNKEQSGLNFFIRHLMIY